MNNSVFLNMEVISLRDTIFPLKFPDFFQLSYGEIMFLGSSESNAVIVYPGCNFADNAFFFQSIVSPPACPCPNIPPPQVNILG